jgi:phosphoheptose isomerase
MKLSFETKNLNDKILVTLFDNGKKVASCWKMNEGSNYVNLQTLKEQMELRYKMENEQFEEEGA